MLFDGLIEAVCRIGASQLSVNQAALRGVLRPHRVGGLINGLLALALSLYRALSLGSVLARLVLGALEFLGLLLQAGRDLFNIRIELVLSVGVSGDGIRAVHVGCLDLRCGFPLGLQRLIHTLHGFTLAGHGADVIFRSASQGDVCTQGTVCLGLAPDHLAGVG